MVGFVSTPFVPQAILHLDTIRARGKPSEPPKKPQAAPFFLPTVPGLNPNPVFDVEPAAGDAGAGSRVRKSLEEVQSRLLQLIRAARGGDYSAVVEYLAGCTPSAIDLEIRSLAFASPSGEAREEGGSTRNLLLFNSCFSLNFLCVEAGCGVGVE